MRLLKGIRLKLFYLLLSVVLLSLGAFALYSGVIYYISQNTMIYLDESMFIDFQVLLEEEGIEKALEETSLQYERADIYDVYGNLIYTSDPSIYSDIYLEGGGIYDFIDENVDGIFTYIYDFQLEDGSILILSVPEIYEDVRQDLYKNMALLFYLVTVLLILGVTSILGARFFIYPIESLKEALVTYEKGDAFDFSMLKDEEFLVLGRSIEEMTERLHEEEDKRKQVILDLAHDIKTPLTSVMGYAEMLKGMEGFDGGDREKYLEVIYKNSARANDIVKSIYDMTAMDARQAFHLTRVNFSELLRETIIVHVTEFERLGLQYGLHIPESDVFALVDSHHMQRVLTNLLSNACKYLKADNRLAFILSLKKETLELVYEDDGPGIDQDLSKSLFDPFVKGDQARTSYESKGLGLSIAKKIIEGHGGTIVADANYSKGLRLIITLKRVE